jgi:hypothetical protein
MVPGPCRLAPQFCSAPWRSRNPKLPLFLCTATRTQLMTARPEQPDAAVQFSYSPSTAAAPGREARRRRRRLLGELCCFASASNSLDSLVLAGALGGKRGSNSHSRFLLGRPAPLMQSPAPTVAKDTNEGPSQDPRSPQRKAGHDPRLDVALLALLSSTRTPPPAPQMSSKR